MNNKYIVFFIYFILGIIFNWYFFLEHFSIDSYPFLYFQEKNGIAIIGTGRALYGFILNILAKSSYFVVEHQFIMMLISVFSLALSAAILYFVNVELIYKISNVRNHKLIKSASFLASYLIVFNAFQSSMAPFIEMFPGSSIALLLVATAVKKLINKKIKSSIVLVIISMFIYQAWVALYIAYFFIVLLELFKKRFLYSLVSAGMAYFFVIVVNYYVSSFLVYLFDLPKWRIGGLNFSRIILQFKFIPQHIFDILTHSYNFLPKNYLFFTTFIFCIIFLFELFKIKNKKQFNILIVIFLIFYVLPLIPTLVADNSYITIRMVMVIPSIVGFLIFLYFLYFGNKKYLSYMVLLMGFFSSMVFLRLSLVEGRNMLDVNKVDERDVVFINNIIKQEEEKNNVVVKYVSFVKDRNITVCRTNKCFPSISESFFIADWANEAGFNYYSKKNFNRTYEKIMSENLDSEEVKKNNLSDFKYMSKEEVIVKDDKVLIVIY